MIEISDYVTIGSAVITGLVTGIGAYIAIMRSSITARKDIEIGFNKLDKVETETQHKIEHLEGRLDNKADRIDTLEKMLFEYLKKHEAEATYAKKDSLDPVINNIIKNQEMLFTDLKEFRNDFKDSINDITNALIKHVNEDRQYQQEVITILKQIPPKRG